MVLLEQLDHLVYATPDLADGIARIEGVLGVRAHPGGTHPEWGTRNAIVPLGPESYLEIIGPDPDRASEPLPRVFGIAELTTPRLVTWAVKGELLVATAERASAAGIDLGEVRSGSRIRPDGTQIHWELTDPFAERAGGTLPFFIDWGASPHPAEAGPSGAQLLELRVEHPEADAVATQLAALGVPLAVSPGRSPALYATVRTARMTVVLA